MRPPAPADASPLDSGGDRSPAPGAAPPLRPLAFFYANTFATLLVGNMFVYALIILARPLAGSEGFTGLVFMANYLPAAVFGLPAGALLDRVSRRSVVMVFQSVYILSAFGLALALHADLVTYESRWILILVSAINGSALTFLIPGRLALLANLVREQDAGRATILLNVLIILGFGLAPLVTGALKAQLGWRDLLLCIGGLYVLAWALLLPVQAPPGPRLAPGNPFAAFREGLAFAFAQPLIRQLLLFELAVLAVLGPIQVLMPQYAKATLDLSEASRGLFLSSLGAGLFLGGLSAGWIQRRSGRGLIMLVFAILMGALFGWIAFQEGALLAGLKLAGAGVFGGALGALIPAALQHATPDHLRGRIMGLYGMIFQLAPALAGLGAGLAADALGLANAIFVCGLFVAGFGMLALALLGRVRRYD